LYSGDNLQHVADVSPTEFGKHQGEWKACWANIRSTRKGWAGMSQTQSTQGTQQVYHQLGTDELIEHSIAAGNGELAASGALAVTTGKFTGRSPKDKFVVEEPGSKDDIWWGRVNAPISEEHYQVLKQDALDHLAQQPALYTQDLYVGADPDYRYPVHLTTDVPWIALFCRHLFIVPKGGEKIGGEQLTIIHAPKFEADPERHGTRTTTAIALNIAERTVVIAGTEYSGECKKSIFTMMNYLLPKRGVASMHCSASVGPDGESTVFFGLSGTGKTTLSMDPASSIIGDDEHGWSENGVFNIEGGCYAKTIKLKEADEPRIWSATNHPGTLIENVPLDPETKVPDFYDSTLTENTRSAFPIEFIPDYVESGMGKHPKRIIFLTADATGVLPPVSKLSKEEAISMFLLGFTSKLAGTERGVTEPQRTFSECFGSPFLPLHPERYADLLGQRIDEHSPSLWLVNTGWTGGSYPTGKRISIAHTRAIVHAITDDSLTDAPTMRHPIFNLEYPTECWDVPSEVLNPKTTWGNKAAYDAAANSLMDSFRKRADEMTIDDRWTAWLKK
jgi:phosphoenolpyruvate carboxykinase (ATP)